MERTNGQRPYRIVVVDDCPLVHEALRAFLAPASDIAIVGHALAAPAGLALVGEHQLDVLIFEVHLDGTVAGLELACQARDACSALALLAFTGPADLFAYHQLGQLGVRGYPRKRAAAERALQVVRLVAAGHTVLDLTAAEAALAARLATLTPREYAVLQTLATGCSTAASAHALQLPTKSAEVDVSRVLSRLGPRCAPRRSAWPTVTAWSRPT